MENTQLNEFIEEVIQKYNEQKNYFILLIDNTKCDFDVIDQDKIKNFGFDEIIDTNLASKIKMIEQLEEFNQYFLKSSESEIEPLILNGKMKNSFVKSSIEILQFLISSSAFYKEKLKQIVFVLDNTINEIRIDNNYIYVNYSLLLLFMEKFTTKRIQKNYIRNNLDIKELVFFDESYHNFINMLYYIYDNKLNLSYNQFINQQNCTIQIRNYLLTIYMYHDEINIINNCVYIEYQKNINHEDTNLLKDETINKLYKLYFDGPFKINKLRSK